MRKLLLIMCKSKIILHFSVSISSLPDPFCFLKELQIIRCSEHNYMKRARSREIKLSFCFLFFFSFGRRLLFEYALSSVSGIQLPFSCLQKLMFDYDKASLLVLLSKSLKRFKGKYISTQQTRDITIPFQTLFVAIYFCQKLYFKSFNWAIVFSTLLDLTSKLCFLNHLCVCFLYQITYNLLRIIYKYFKIKYFYLFLFVTCFLMMVIALFLNMFFQQVNMCCK